MVQPNPLLKASDLHGSATTTPEIRKAIQTSGQSIRALAETYGINPKTVAKWKSRATVSDLPMGPKNPVRRALTPAEQATCLGFRLQTALPLDDCLYALQLMMPHLTRSTLHRLFDAHGMGRLKDLVSARRSSVPRNAVEIGHFYIDTAEIRTGDGKANMLFAFDQHSKVAFARLSRAMHPSNGARFLGDMASCLPYRIKSVLTGNSDQFRVQTVAASADDIRDFNRICLSHDIVHRLLPPEHPWNIGRIGRARPKDRAQTGDLAYSSHAHLQHHFFAFFDRYNFERRLKTLSGRTPFEFVRQYWETNPQEFAVTPAADTLKLR